MPAIHFTAPRNWIELHPDDAKELGVQEGDWVKVSSKRGSIYVEARIVDTLQPKVAWMPFHYAEGANVLADSSHLDPVSKIPGFKQIGIRIEKVSAQKAKELTAQAQNDAIEYYENEDPKIIRYEEKEVEDLISARKEG